MDIINPGATDGLPVVDWTTTLDKLEAGPAPDPGAHNAKTTWLTTINDDGSPHITAVGAIWLDGTYWFQTGPTTRKHRNASPILAARSRSRSATPMSWSKASPSA